MMSDWIVVLLLGTLINAASGEMEHTEAVNVTLKTSGGSLRAMIRHAEKSLPQPLLSARQMARAMYHGDDERLRRFLTRAYSGEKVRIVAIGASITFGLGLKDKSLGWVQRLKTWAASAWPQGNVEVLSGAFPAVNSAYMSTCLQVYCPEDVHLAIVELSANDQASFTTAITQDVRRGFERLVRKLLDRPSRPAVLLLNTHQLINIDTLNVQHPYLDNAEAFYFDVSTYYGLPSASMKAAMWSLAQTGLPGFWINASGYQLDPSDPNLAKYFNLDRMHPGGDNGHRLLFDLVSSTLMRGSHSLIPRMYNAEIEDDIVMGSLPEPIFKDNYEAKKNLCLLGEHLKAAAIKSEGFDWVNEAQGEAKMHSPKWGFTALKAGSAISFSVDTRLDRLSHGNDKLVEVSLAYLRSYEHMGKATVSCSSCLCNASSLDGHHMKKESVLHMWPFTVSQSQTCTITVTALEETSSGEHKVKIGGIIIGEGDGRVNVRGENARDQLMAAIALSSNKLESGHHR